MKTNTPPTPTSPDYTGAMRTVMLGIVIGAMFAAVSLAASTAAESNQRLLEKQMQRQEASSQPRLQVLLHGPQSSSLQTAETTATAALKLLQESNNIAALEMVTIEVPLTNDDLTANDTESTKSNFNVRQELIELLTRRAETLKLQLRLRTAPQHADKATELLDELNLVSVSSNPLDPAGHRLAVSLDSRLPPNSLFIDVLRTVELAPSKELSP